MVFTKVFRQSFTTPVRKDFLLWFPGHMNKGLRQMRQILKEVDCVVEVHDARIPLSGRNALFQADLLGVRPHLLVLNKCDLTDMSYHDKVKRALKSRGGISDILYTDCRVSSGRGVDKIVPTIVDIISKTNRYSRSAEKNLNLLVIGVPNVGKSSFINVLRNLHVHKKNAARVGAIAGITRSVMNKIQVCYDPPMFLLDTPGILEPRVTDVEPALRLALCASMQDHLVGEALIADYMLYWLNKNCHFSYVEKLGLDRPHDEIVPFLVDVCAKNNLFQKVRNYEKGGYSSVPNTKHAAGKVINMFRTGKFGKFLVDVDLL